MALTVVIIGAAIAWFKYGRGPVADTAPTNVSVFTRIARRDLLQDDFNESVFMRPGQALTRLLVKTDDVVVDGTVRGVASAALASGSSLRSTQSGFVRSYAALIVIGAISLIAAIWAVTL
jgi:NADH-quinone oxidoreductase subunit L